MKDAEHNLLEFYRKIGGHKDYSFRDYKNWSVVSAPSGYWPSLIINLNGEKEREYLLGKMAGEIRSEGIPSLFIADAGLFGPAHVTMLRRNNFFPVDKWTVMEKNTSTIDEMKIMAGCAIRPLLNLTEIASYTSIVNTELFRTLPADPGLLHRLAKSAQFALYGCFAGNELASGLMVFLSGDTAGLYLVVTRKEKQGLGFGSALLSHAVSKIKEAGVSKIILHSSLQAVSFYKNNGFTIKGEIYIYRYSIT